MYLHLGQSAVVDHRDIIGIFDLDNTTQSHRTRAFLERAEREEWLTALGDGLPKSFVLCRKKNGESMVYISQLASATLRSRVEAFTSPASRNET